MTGDVLLRDLAESDLPTVFEQQLDPERRNRLHHANEFNREIEMVLGGLVQLGPDEPALTSLVGQVFDKIPAGDTGSIASPMEQFD